MERVRRLTAGPVAGVLAAVVLVGVACGPPPSPSPTGPADRLTELLAAPDLNLTAGLEGTYQLADGETYPVWGAFAVDGKDSRTLATLEGPFGIEAWERIERAGSATTRRGAEPFGPAATAEPDDSLRAALAGLKAVEDLGAEERDGRTVRHVRASGLELGPALLGIEGDASASGGALDAWLDEHGAPVAMRLESGPLVLDIDDIRIGGAAPIPPPYELARLASPALRYLLVHPAGAGVSERGTSGHLIGLEGAYVITYCAAGTMKLPNWVIEGTELYNSLWGAEPEAVEPLTVESAAGPTPATLSTWHGTTEGKPAYIMDLAVVADGVACDVQWFSPPGNEAADRARFEQLLAGFRLGG